MKRLLSCTSTLLATGLISSGLWAQQPASPRDPVKTWQRQTQKAMAQFGSDFCVNGEDVQLTWTASEAEWRLNLTHASHERAAAVWAATEVFKGSSHDPTSRQVYVQAINTAYQQYAQANQTAYQAWAQATNQGFQSWQQKNNQALQANQQDLNSAYSTASQAIPNLETSPEAITWQDWQVLPGLQAGKAEADKAFGDAVSQAKAKYDAAIAAANQAWEQSCAQATTQSKTDAASMEEATSQLRKANKIWMTTALGALEDLRSDFRTGLRKYQLQTMPD